jgi:hypothetical protein
MKIAYLNDLKENDYINADFFASHCVYIKSLLRACSFDLFVNHQIRNHLWKFCLIRVARKIEQRQCNDDSIYEDSENRLHIVFEDFRVTSLKILKQETHVQFIYFYLSHLQVVVKNRLIKHEHRTLIDDFCNRIKNKLIETRERRRQREVLTSNEHK